MSDDGFERIAKEAVGPVQPVTGRRNVLQWLLGGFLVAVGATFIGPVAAYLSPTSRKGGQPVLVDDSGKPVPMKALDTQAFVIGSGLDDENTIVFRYGGEVRAMSIVCTHLGCNVKWEPSRGEFLCPCHAGRFDANGVNIAGPPPAPLKRFRATATAEGMIGLERISGVSA